MRERIKIDINTAILLAAITLALAIVAGTIAALLAGKRPGADYRRLDPAGIEDVKGAAKGQKEFKEFGTLRIRLLPNENSKAPAAVLVVTPWLSYNGGDSAFYEELVSKKRLFSSYITEYFSTKTKNALLSTGESEAKRDLLERFNGQLSLGKISAIYFDDYIFME